MKNWPFFSILLITIIFFWQFFAKGFLPIPSDTIVGLYHPFRDIYAKEYPRGIPFKNFLITDPVRQQYPWRNLSIELEKRFELPLWNPYSFSGTPLLANFQSGAFYPLNILFFILPFYFAWSFLIILEPLLVGLFLYLFLRNLKLSKLSSTFSAITFSLSGFTVAWLEWGTIIHTALWMPLILLSIDKILIGISNSRLVAKRVKFKISNPQLLWSFVFIFSLIASFFAGHPQVFFYLFVVSLAYLLVRWIQYGKNKKILGQFIVYCLLFIIITSVQWIPTVQFISLSGRDIDQLNWQRDGWFIPWQNLTQFFAPDFFGNPTTLNYWGIFNYGEFVGYVGILSLIFAIFALFFRRDKKTLFFGTLFFLSLIFSLPTIFAKIPYLLDIPFISSTQPTRLLLVTDLSLAILAGLGLDLFLKNKKGIIFPTVFVAIVFGLLWAFTKFGSLLFSVQNENLIVSQRNLILPTLLFLLSIALIYFSIFLKSKKIRNFIYLLFLFVIAFDLLRFGLKFNPFTNKEYLFPESKTLSFLKSDKSLFRVMTDDSRIFAPNFSLMYKVQSVDGYDPLYLERYAQLIAASERGEPNISPPFGFNRIITPHNFESKIIDLLGVKYVLSLKDLESPKLEKVFSEGETRVYKNINAYPRTFFVENVIYSEKPEEAIKKIFSENLETTAIVEDKLEGEFIKGKAEIVSFRENKITIKTENEGEGFLVLVETFYPSWRAKIDGKDTRVYRTDFNFRGIIVPKGEQTIEFYSSLF